MARLVPLTVACLSPDSVERQSPFNTPLAADSMDAADLWPLGASSLSSGMQSGRNSALKTSSGTEMVATQHEDR